MLSQRHWFLSKTSGYAVRGCEHWARTSLNLGCLEHIRSESERQLFLMVGRRVNTSVNS